MTRPNIPSFSRIQKSHVLYGLVIFWAAVQCLLFATGGIRPGGDSSRYIGAANDLLNGTMPSVAKAWSYLAYDFFVALIFGLGWGIPGVIAVQVLVSGIAGLALYRLGEFLFDWRAGVFAVLLFIGFPDIQKWNYYVLTESLFISVIILTCYAVMAMRGKSRIIFSAFLLVLALFMRPNGFIVPLALALYMFIQLWRQGRRQLVLTIAAVGIAVVTMASLWVGDMLAKENIISKYAEGTVIWGHPESAIQMPGQMPDCLAANGNVFASMFCFISDKPVFFIQLIVFKLSYFVSVTRPYYSVPHNLLILAVLLPTYLLAVASWVRYRHKMADMSFPLIIIVLQALMVAMTFADWDSRHMLVMLPLFFLYASGSAGPVFSRFRRGMQT